MKPSHLLTRRSTVWTTLLLVMLLVASLTGVTGATPPSSPSAPFSPSTLAPGDENWDDRFNTLGLNGTVYSMATSGSDVYAGGYFTTAGGVSANSIVKWDGSTSTWSPLGSGVSGGDPIPEVHAIAISGSDVYVGGEFTTAGELPANRIAKWNGSTWSALGSGVSGGSPSSWVNEMAISGSDVYVGGHFTLAGGVPANSIAKWNGSTWSALGSGVSGDFVPTVRTTAVNGSDVYVGGNFTTAGGVTANSIAKWNGSTWSALGSGVNDTVWAIGISGSDVYVGGEFTTAGVNVSNHFGIWHMPPVNLMGHVTWAGQSQPNALQQRPITLTLCSTSGGPTSTYTGTTDASGFFTVNVASLISGTYNWRDKGFNSLANGGTLTLTGSDQQAEMGAQAGGDADNDNIISISDFNIMKSTFGLAQGDPGYDERGDFDNSSNINITDFNIQKSNFGQAGVPVTCP